MKSVLFIGMVWPEPSTTAAGGRMLQLIELFLKNGYQVHFASTAQKSEHSHGLEKMGVREVEIMLNHSSFDRLLQDLCPQIAVFDRFLTEEQFGWRVREHLPNTLRILDTEDLHSLRKVRQEALEKSLPFTPQLWLAAEITKREMASILRSDLSLIVSTVEMSLLRSIIKVHESLLLHLPFLMAPPSPGTINAWKSYEERADFVCIGNGMHLPNVDAIRWLNSDIWPLIRSRLPLAKVRIYGAYLPKIVQQMHRPDQGFLIMGKAGNALSVLEQARLNLAPLRFGAGIKGKLTDSMCAGTPSITTDIGAEGMHDGLPWSGAIANDKEDFAQKALDLYTDPLAWGKAQRNGIDIIRTIYDKEILESRFMQRLNTLRNGLEEHRNQNFIGSMLMHHTLASSKYFSKWIEAKNP
ncbi:MAG: glycosyltransferase [Sediminicola sp.]